MKILGSVCQISVACLVLTLLPSLRSGDSLPVAVEGEAKSTKKEDWTRRRKAAAHRRRRIIFNNDGCDAVYFCREATPQALLECRTSALVGTQVDAIFYCTWSSGFSNFTHSTKVGAVFTRREDKLSNNKMGEFIKQATDPLRIMVDFCRQKNIEIFWSMRMNDTHDASSAWYGPLLLPQLKKDHPEFLLGSRDNRPKHAQWTAVDYGRQEIRELAFRFVEEVCENYDVDGVELDFFRHLNYFKRPAAGQDAGPQERALMTELLARIREMTERVGVERGRPLLVAVRVPDSAGYCAALGLDIVRWMREDLIDILVPSGYFRLNPWSTSVRLGHEYGVPVYPCLSESRLKGEARKVRASIACYRSRALNAWDSGADGIYIFNFFDPSSPLWRELGDPRALETMDKVYCTGARGLSAANRWLADGLRFLNRSPLSPERPLALRPGATATVKLRVGEDLRNRTRQGLRPEVTLRLRVRELSRVEDISVKVNDVLLSGGASSGGWLEYGVKPEAVKRGENRFEILLDAGSASQAVAEDLLLRVRFSKDPGRSAPLR